METLKVASQYILVGVATLGLMLVNVLPAIAAAEQVTARSAQLSNSSAASTNVTYSVNFTSVNAAQAFVIDFCTNSPLVGQACDAPAGFSAVAADSTTDGFSDNVTGSANRVVVGGAIGASSEVEVEITGINNPTNPGTLYARVATFDLLTSATSSTPTSLSGMVDSGGIALAITPTIGVSGLVLETMTFCVSKEEIPANCGSTEAPVLVLGEETSEGSGVYALVQDEINEGSIFTQISTNASSGAVVRLKSNALNCGGLLRAGAPGACDIAPALAGGIDPTNTALFGIRTSTAFPTDGVANANGLFVPVSELDEEDEPFTYYSNANFAMRFVENNTTGVTSTYGDPFLDTAGAPVNNQNMQLTFGVTVSNDTPAGTYSADLSLIAVGKF